MNLFATRIGVGLAALALAGIVSAQELTGVLKRVKETGEITIGVSHWKR